MKKIADDNKLRTDHAAFDLYELATSKLNALKNGEKLGQEEVLRLVHQLDLLAVVLPDNFSHSWDADLANQASKLRATYHKKFGERAYEF